MKKLAIAFGLAISSLSLTACGSLSITEKDVAAAMKFDEDLVKAVLNKNAAALDEFYTDDAIIMAPNGEMITGKEAISEFHQEFVNIGITKFELNAIRVEGAGDLLYMVGKSNISCESGEANPNCSNGNYMCVLNRQQNGSWKKSIAIWNSREPIFAESLR